MKRNALEYFTGLYLYLCTLIVKNAWATEVTESIWMLDNSLGFEINLPVLTCRTKYSEYSEVRWYKDSKLVKQSPQGKVADRSDHLLVVPDLLKNTSYVQFDHPLQLQGYYWCETDYVKTSAVLRYLFQLNEVQTFSGKLWAHLDDLGDDEEELSSKDKIMRKRKIYENDMQQVLFGFLPLPNTYVTDIMTHPDGGLEIYFYLYVRHVFNPRENFDAQLVRDKHELDYIFEYLNNDAATIDEEHYREIIEWVKFKGILIPQIDIYSTLGCYETVSSEPKIPQQKLKWPDAAIGEVVIPEESCSSGNGLAVTRLCTGSFYTGARWGNPSGKCDVLPTNFTKELKQLYEKFRKSRKPVYLKQLQEFTTYPSQLSVTDLHLIVSILTEVSEVSNLLPLEIDQIFAIIDKIGETDDSELIAAIQTIKLSSRLLRVIDKVLLLATGNNKEFISTQQHILVETKHTETDDAAHVIGLAILAPKSDDESLGNASMESLLSDESLPKESSLAYFLLPPDLVFKREEETSGNLECQINVVFFRDWSLLPKPKKVLTHRNYRVLPTPVIHVTLSGGPAWNLLSPVQLYFRDVFKRKIENPVCVHFDPRLDGGQGGWSTEGCKFGGLYHGYYNCRCNHLSIFAVILSEDPETNLGKYRLGTTVYIGCTASIIALSFAVILYCLAKEWRTTVDHHILFWIAFSFLCCVLMLYISEMHFKMKPNCRLLAFLLNYTLLVTLGWLLVQAIMNRLRFANKTDIAEVPHFVLKSFFSVWVSPILIVILIWVTSDVKYLNDRNCLSTLLMVSRCTLIPIGVVIFVTLCLNMCAIYAISCRFKQDFLIGNATYPDSVLKFRITVTIFFLFVITWLFGFLSLNGRSKELRILFSISLTLTAYYITLFFVFHEVSLWELCRRWRGTKNSDEETVKYVPKTEIKETKSSKQ